MLSLIYENKDMPFQITWKDETCLEEGTMSLLQDSIPFYSGGMGEFVTDGYYPMGHLLSLAKGGNRISSLIGSYS